VNKLYNTKIDNRLRGDGSIEERVLWTDLRYVWDQEVISASGLVQFEKIPAMEIILAYKVYFEIIRNFSNI
jgi:hypothetical protein